MVQSEAESICQKINSYDFVEKRLQGDADDPCLSVNC